MAGKIFAFLALAIVAGLVCWALTQPVTTLQIAAGAGFLAIIAAVLLLDIGCGRFRVANVKNFILFGFAFFLGLGMIADTQRADYTFSGTAIVLTYASLLLFLLGFELAGHSGIAKGCVRPKLGVTIDQIYVLSIILFVLGFSFLGLEWKLFNQLQSYSGTLVSGTGQVTRPRPYVHDFTQLIAPASLMAFIQIRRGTLLARKWVLGAFLVPTVVWYFFWGARGNFLWLVLTFLIVWSEVPNRHGSRRLGMKPLIVCVLGIGIMLILSVVRNTMDTSTLRALDASAAQKTINGSIDTFYQLRRTLEYFPQRADFLWGYTFYGIVVNPIPRTLWDGKPVGVGLVASVLYDHDPHTSLGLSLPGELYANFGFAGALIGVFLFGLGSGKLYQWYLRHQGQFGPFIVYVLLLAYGSVEVRGDMLDASMPIFYCVLPVATILGLVSTMNMVRARQERLAAGTMGSRHGQLRFRRARTRLPHQSILRRPT